MSFASELRAFATKTVRDEKAVFVTTVTEVRESVKFGSALTGAPAMPVAPGQFKRAGALRDSVIATYPDDNTALISTTSPYAPDVEDNPKGHTFNSGGPHGWKLTIAAFPKIVDAAVSRLGRAR